MTRRRITAAQDSRREQYRRDFSRPITIHICKDGTISYRAKHEPIFNGVALPVFTVNTVQQAQDIQVMYGRKQWTDHPDMAPGQSWYRWTDFSGDVDALDGITETLRGWWEKYGG